MCRWRCWFKSRGSMLGLVSHVQWRSSNEDFSSQSVISRVYSSRLGNGTGSLGTSAEVVLKKYRVLHPVENPPKVNRTVPWKRALEPVEPYTDFAAVGTNYWFVWPEGNWPPDWAWVSPKVFFSSVLSPMEFGFLCLLSLWTLHLQRYHRLRICVIN